MKQPLPKMCRHSSHTRICTLAMSALPSIMFGNPRHVRLQCVHRIDATLTSTDIPVSVPPEGLAAIEVPLATPQSCCCCCCGTGLIPAPIRSTHALRKCTTEKTPLPPGSALVENFSQRWRREERNQLQCLKSRKPSTAGLSFGIAEFPSEEAIGENPRIGI